MSYVRPTLTVLALVGVVELAVLSHVLWERNDWSVPGQTAIAQDACTEAQTFTGTGSRQTQPFRITGNRWQFTYTLSNLDQGTQGGLVIAAYNADNNQIVANASQETEGTNSSSVNEGPGTFYLDVTSVFGDWTITVEDCGGTGGGTTDPQPTPTPSPQPTPQAREQTGLLEAGGKTRGPVPVMPSGGCPAEFPKMRGGLCHRV